MGASEKPTYHLAIDIGASSGRCLLGWVDQGRIKLEEVHRFTNVLVRQNGHDCWNIEALFQNTLEGLKKCREAAKVPATLGIDTWGVDFVLIDQRGELVGDAVAYRDARTQTMVGYVENLVNPEHLYHTTGIQRQPFNTIYQLAALKREHPEQLICAQRFLMIPDYLNYLLTGVACNEYTNATTTNLLNARTRRWDNDLLEILGVPTQLFGEVMAPGAALGGLTQRVQGEVGFDVQVMLPATHDTGSAFLAVPARNKRAVYLSSGTWSLLGVENEGPITTDASRLQNFTNEGGYLKRFRFLKNIMGLWMIQSVRRELNGVDYVQGKNHEHSQSDHEVSFSELASLAGCEKKPMARINVNDERFLAPASMIEEIKVACKETSQPIPETTGQIMRVIYESLAGCYADSVAELSALTGLNYTSINIVGGGCQDNYLNELTAQRCQLPVYAGPVEGTSLGNLMVQMIRAKEFRNLNSAREALRTSFDVQLFNP